MNGGHDPIKWLQKKAKAGGRGYPFGTVLFYGPDERRASKVVASIKLLPDPGLAELRRWTSDTSDLRRDRAVLKEVVDLFRFYGVRSIGMAPKIVGCAHEEGTDYPEGDVCPQCPFWIGRDRWEGVMPRAPGF